jgi:hypothetical protein
MCDGSRDIYSQYGPCRSNSNGSVLLSFDFKPYPAEVSNGERGSPKHGIVGGPGGLHGVGDLLSSNVVVGPTCVFCGDTVPFLQVDREGAFEHCTLIRARNCNPCSKHVVSPISWGS